MDFLHIFYVRMQDCLFTDCYSSILNQSEFLLPALIKCDTEINSMNEYCLKEELVNKQGFQQCQVRARCRAKNCMTLLSGGAQLEEGASHFLFSRQEFWQLHQSTPLLLQKFLAIGRHQTPLLSDFVRKTSFVMLERSFLFVSDECSAEIGQFSHSQHLLAFLPQQYIIIQQFNNSCNFIFKFQNKIIKIKNIFESMKIKNSHELSYFHAQAILHLQSIFNYYRKQENGQLGVEDEKFVEAIHKFSKEFISLSKLKTKSQSFQAKENEEKTDSHKEIRSSFSIDQEIISEVQGPSIKKRIASEALELQTEIDEKKSVRKRKKWWDKCELKSKRKGIFVASSPEFKEKKSSSCQNLNLKSKEVREEKSNNQLKISNVSEFSKKKQVFEESITTKVSSTLNIQKKALSAKNLPTQLSFSVPNKSEKKSLFDSQLRDRENVGSSSRNIIEPWRKVVDTSKVHPNSLSLTTSKKKISNIENEILNPQQMRELFMKKKLKIDKNNYIPKTITEYR